MKNILIRFHQFQAIRLLAIFVLCLSGVLYLHGNAQAKPVESYKASSELGQYTYTNSYTQSTSNNGAGNSTPGPLGLYSPYGTALDSVNHRLFVTDHDNSRILVYSLNSSNQLVQKSPTAVLGQPNFFSRTASSTQATLDHPISVAYDSDGQRLFVADQSNNRILVFDVSITALAIAPYGEGAQAVVGQNAFNTHNFGTSQTALNLPSGVAYDSVAARLFVTDYGNSRVMVFDAATSTLASTSTGAFAEAVIGQSSFGGGSSHTSQNGLSLPVGLTFDSINSRLFVNDMFNNRVMVFDASTSTLASTSTGAFAEAVLGQNSYSSSGFDHTANTMFIPQGNLDYDGNTGRLFVPDTANSRILVFDASPATLTSTPTGESAEAVLGQQSFSGGTGGTNQYQIELPEGATFDPINNQLFVSDTENNRILVFDASDSALADTPLGENALDEVGQYSSLSDINNPSYLASNANNGLSTTSAVGLYAPSYVLVDSYNHRLFVSDANNNRVLIYPLDGNNHFSTSSAQYVLGQSSMTASSSATSQSGLNAPVALAFDLAGERLFVADALNSRVLVYDVSPGTLTGTPAGENAEAVLGQTGFATSTSLSLGQNSLHLAQGLAYDSNTNRLFVADSINNRVLVFDASVSALTNTPAGENAQAVLGQASFSTNTATTTQNGFHIPQGLAFDSSNNRLFVSDGFNNRVLVFDASTSTLSNTPMGESAQNVLGQSDYTSSSSGINNHALNTTQVGFVGLSYSSQTEKLYVADEINNRVVAFNVALSSIQNGENESSQVGQVGFTLHNAATTQGGLSRPNGIFYDDSQNQLFVADKSNSRIMLYTFIQFTTASMPDGAVNSNYSQPLSTQHGQTAGSFTIFSGSLPPGLSVDTDARAISGVPTTAGSYNFTLEADDSISSGNWTTRQNYSITIAGLPSSGGGGGLPAVAYNVPVAPPGGLQITIDNGATKVTDPLLLVSSNGGSDIKYLALSTDPSFTNIGLIPYNSTLQWNLCGAPTCAAGNYTVYAKFYTSWGQQSVVVTANVNFQPGSKPASTSSPALKNNSAPQTVVTTLPANKNIFKTTLRVGSRGAEVTALQTFLSQNPSLYPESLITGLFGKLTQAAVEKFQIKYSIASPQGPGYGLVGPKTRSQLNQLAGQTP